MGDGQQVGLDGLVGIPEGSFLQPGQLPRSLIGDRNLDAGEQLQATAEATLAPARRRRHRPEDSLVGGQQGYDAIGLAKFVALQDDGIGLNSAGHVGGYDYGRLFSPPGGSGVLEQLVV